MYSNWKKIADETQTPILIVSKRASIERILELAEQLPAECRLFGENYQASLIEKIQHLNSLESVPANLRFHFIGHLQSNKIRKMFEQDRKHQFIQCVQTLDNRQTVQALQKVLAELGRTIEVMIQVNVAEKPQQSGCAVTEVAALREFIESQPNLKLIGLMCIADSEDPEPSMQRMAKFKKETGLKLSMGMSGDRSLAVKYGSDLLRIGTDIFGST